MIDLVLRMATGWRAASALAALVVGGGLLFRLSPYDEIKSRLGGANLPEEGLTTPSELIELLQALGSDGRALYLEFQAWDVLNPILIGLAGALLLGWLLKRTDRAMTKWRYLILLPVGLLASDLLENLLISVALKGFPEPSSLGAILPWITTAKFGAAMGTMIGLLVLLLLLLRDRLSGRPQGPT